VDVTGELYVRNKSVSVQFCNSNGRSWWLTCVYGPQGNSEKVLFLHELRDLRLLCHGPWMIAGDFNMIYKAEDKNNSNINRVMMGRFRSFINDLALSELPLFGQKFTWSSQQNPPTLVKLDRVLCTLDWVELFLNSLLQRSASNDSDHCPLLLGLNDNSMAGRRRFYFESFWPKFDGFLEAISLAWHSVPAVQCPFATLNSKLKSTARGLQAWSAKKVGHISASLALARVLLHQFEIAQDSRGLSPAELSFLLSLKKHSLALSSLQRTIARPRSRIGWLREGDANTKLFHMHSRFRKKKNFVPKLVSNCAVLTSHDAKAGLVNEFYAIFWDTAAIGSKLSLWKVWEFFSMICQP
jgi:hypothetical protein